MSQDDSLCVKIVDAIEARENREIEALEPPLYEVIDMDALEQLVRPAAPFSGGEHAVVSFSYRGYTITVDSSEQIEVVSEEAGSPHQPVRTPSH